MVEALLTTGTFPEKAVRNHEIRLRAVRDILLDHEVESVLDLGCGDAKLIELLLGEPGIDKVLGIDHDPRRLTAGRQRIDSLYGGYKTELAHGSFLELDESLADFDAAVLVETIEHIEPEQLPLLERELFGKVQPRLVVVTTPNATKRITLEQMAHRGHFFEWDIPEFENWVEGVSRSYPYLGEIIQLNGPSFVRGTQIAVFNYAP